MRTAGITHPVMKRVEAPIWVLRTDWTLSEVVVLMWTKRTDNHEAIVPEAVAEIGKKRELGWLTSSYEVEETTKAAQVDSARDPKRSDPIPAISPTLSPTLSAMVPGLLISSSFKSLMTLPTRSAPTSAALV